MTVKRGATRLDHFGKAIIRIVMIHRARRDQFVLHEHGGRHLPLVQNVETHSNQIVAVSFWKEGHRSDQASARLTKFSTPFRRGVLPHDGAVLCAPSFLKSA